METNLVTLWSIQPASGLNRIWFTSQEQARSRFNKFAAEVESDFAAWERGEPGHDAVVQSSLEGDGFGGCIEVFTVSPHARPFMDEHEPRTLKWRPDGLPDWAWGNPATARPRKG